MIICLIPLHAIEDRGRGVLTVDSDGDALGENEAVSTLEGRDLAELVELQVLAGNTLGRLGLDELNVEAVLLCDREEGCGARVTLLNSLLDLLFRLQSGTREGYTYRIAVELSERHDCDLNRS